MVLAIAICLHALPNSSVELLAVPERGITILRQICFSTRGDNSCVGGRVERSTVGNIAATTCSAAIEPGQNCTIYEPGLILPPSEVLSRVGDGGFSLAANCTASAIVLKK